MKQVNSPISPSAILRGLPRVIDARPIWAQLNITWKCNLDCAYCTEYDNSKGHVPYDDVVARIEKCRDLGVLHADLIGGEPLLHPDLVRIMRHVRQCGMTTGMTTNGFRLTRANLEELIDAGMGRIQISVDALDPKPGAPKSLKTLRKKIEMVASYPIWFRVNTVICEETVDEVEEVAETCFAMGVGVNFSVVHERGRLVRGPMSARFLEKVRWLKDRKQQGRDVFTPYFLIQYYEDSLQGRPMDWTCHAGNKCFYVSPEGQFHFCAHVPPVRPLLDVTPTELATFRERKGCEEDCGVDCVVNTALPYSRGAEVLRIEARDRLGELRTRAGALLGRAGGSGQEPAAHNGTQSVGNGAGQPLP